MKIVPFAFLLFVSATIIHKNEVIWTKAFGFADRDQNTLAESDQNNIDLGLQTV